MQELNWKTVWKPICNKLLQWKMKGVQKHQTSEDTNYSIIRSRVSVHSPRQLQRHLQQHPSVSRVNSHTCTFEALPHTVTPMQSTEVRRVDEIRHVCVGHNVAPSKSGFDPVANANVYFRSLNKLNPSIAMDLDCCAVVNRDCTVLVEIATSDCSS